uniref:Uncharacterized protein n=1 Tax=Arundo donax TaxID=35708 RepID=A0A0A9CAZ7_ARUDO
MLVNRDTLEKLH